MFAFLPSLGSAELVLVGGSALTLIASVILAVWGIVDAATRDVKQWQAVGLSRGMWVALMALGTFFCFPLGLICAVYYLTSIRKRLGGVVA